MAAIRESKRIGVRRGTCKLSCPIFPFLHQNPQKQLTAISYNPTQEAWGRYKVKGFGSASLERAGSTQCSRLGETGHPLSHLHSHGEVYHQH